MRRTPLNTFKGGLRALFCPLRGRGHLPGKRGSSVPRKPRSSPGFASPLSCEPHHGQDLWIRSLVKAAASTYLLKILDGGDRRLLSMLQFTEATLTEREQEGQYLCVINRITTHIDSRWFTVMLLTFPLYKKREKKKKKLRKRKRGEVRKWTHPFMAI